ncbi:MAG: hypothetical protein ACREJN_09785, partial [Nitrospiraceae bacterium]
MNQQADRKSFIAGSVAIGVIAGVAAGFFTAHSMTGDKTEMTMGPGVVSATTARGDDMGDMQGMPGMSAAPSGAVVVPAV